MEQQFSNNSDKLPIIIYEYFISGWKDPERRSMLENHYYKQHENLLHYLQKGVENGEFQPNVDLDVINKIGIWNRNTAGIAFRFSYCLAP